MQIDHPDYGHRLSKDEYAELFGIDRAHDRRGIVQRDGKIAWILVKTGAGQTYPNEVTSSQIRYCYSPDGKANAAMKLAYAQYHYVHRQ